MLYSCGIMKKIFLLIITTFSIMLLSGCASSEHDVDNKKIVVNQETYHRVSLAEFDNSKFNAAAELAPYQESLVVDHSHNLANKNFDISRLLPQNAPKSLNNASEASDANEWKRKNIPKNMQWNFPQPNTKNNKFN
jgi:uncharacterized protein YceK